MVLAAWVKTDRAISAAALFSGAIPVFGAVYLSLGGSNPLGDCRFQQLFGFPAPSCGLTRSFVALVQADFSSAIAYHLFGPILLSGMVICAIQGFAELCLGQPFASYGYRWASSHPKATGSGLLIFAVGFGLYYAARLYARYQLVPTHFEHELFQAFITGAHQL